MRSICRNALQTSHPHVQVTGDVCRPRLRVWPHMPDSPLRHELNASLLKIVASDSWPPLVANYLGKSDN